MLKEIFKGLESAYGQTKITNEIRSDGKAEVKSFTIKKPVTDQLWQEHIKMAGTNSFVKQKTCAPPDFDLKTIKGNFCSLIFLIRAR